MDIRTPSRFRTVMMLSVLASAVYLSSTPWHPFPGSAIVKGGSVAALGFVAWGRSRLLVFALLASAAGDVLLDVDPAGLFVAGLCAFLIAHLAYVALFVSMWPSPFRVGPFQGTVVALVVLYAAGIRVWLGPTLGSLAVPVSIYMAVITAMVACSMPARAPWTVPVGAVLFLVSDSCLAVAKFKGSFAFRDYVVWASYYAAQVCITIGILKALRSSAEERRMARSHAAR